MIVRFREIGNSMAVTIPKDVVNQLGISQGEKADISVVGRTISIKPLVEEVTIESLFANYVGDYKPTEIDWGEAKGTEVW